MRVHFCRNAMIKQHYIYRTTLKTSESHLLSVVTNVLKQQLSDVVKRQRLIRTIKKQKEKISRDYFPSTLRKQNFVLLPKFIFPIHLIVGSLVEAYLKEEDKAWANYPKKNKLSSVKGL